MIARFLTILLLVISFSIIASPLAATAQNNKSQTEIVNDLGVNSGGNGKFNLPNNDLSNTTLQRILQTVFTVAGIVAVIFVAVGGLRYVLSEGNDQKIKQAKDTITYSIVGLIISISAYGIVGFFLSSIL